MKSFFTIFLSLLFISSYAQDTIVVQAFNFDSETRDSMISFPEIDHNEFEKIIMMYTMRCKDGLISTGADRNRGCGEWDYSCNTSIIDSSRTDSLKRTHPTYLITGFDGNIFDYTTQAVYSYYQYDQQEVSLNGVNNGEEYALLNDQLNINHPFGGTATSSKSYYLIKTSDYADFIESELKGLRMEFESDLGDVDFLRIKLSHTPAVDISEAVTLENDFTQVYFQDTEVLSGTKDFVFYAPFTWNKSDNILVEISYTGIVNPGQSIGAMDTSLVSAYSEGVDNYLNLNESYTLDVPATSMVDVKDEITVAMWINGNPNALPKNTSIFHANDANGVRQLNVHLPWSNSQVYWDCGNDGSGYDRINKTANLEDFAGKWNHWTFTKNVATGSMKIYLNGALWHSGTGFTKTMDIDVFTIGSSNAHTNYFNGDIDDFSVWDVELSEAEIKDLMHRKLDGSHPNFSNLVSYYDFNEGQGSVINDQSSYQMSATIGGSPLWRSTLSKDVFKGFNFSNEIANMTLLSGDYDISITTNSIIDSIQNPQTKVVAFSVVGTDLIEEDPVYYWPAGETYLFDEEGNVIETYDVPLENSLFVFNLAYYSKSPSKFELLSFVTPYGIGLDFGLDGVSWPIDVSDFGPILKGEKRLVMDRGGQWQEEMDIKFLFIRGTPPRDIMDIHQVWPVTSNGYVSITSNERLEPKDIPIEDNVEFLEVRVATTGHGQEGEFIPRDHWVDINGGFDEFRWSVWKECAFNPVYPQGGTWVYDRAGWCPGEQTDLRQWDFTPVVAGDSEFNIDYGMSSASGDSRYIVNTQVVKYGDYNFNNEASLEKIISPSLDVENTRLNPICGEPVILIRNNGKNVLSSLDIYYGVEGGETYNYRWTGSLVFDETKEVSLPPIKDGQWNKSNTFFAYIENTNGQMDESPNNNRLESNFETTEYLPGDLIVSMRTNWAATETKWYLRDIAGNVIASKASGLSANTTYTDTISGLNGCYSLQFTDTGAAGQDGISWWANNDGNGYIQLRGSEGPWATLEPDFGAEITYRFTIGQLTSTVDIPNEKSVKLFPNPAMDVVWIELEGFTKQVDVKIYDQLGKLVYEKSKTNLNAVYDEFVVDITNFEQGNYFVHINDGVKLRTEKLFILR